MSRRSLIDRQLRPRDRDRFHRYLDDPRRSIDDALAWLRGRGIKTSRTAVGRYSRNRSAAMSSCRLASSAAGLRGQLGEKIHRLPSDDLRTLTLFANFLLLGMPAGCAKRVAK
jgi:hypothetical protein